jgi:hypothetical protein
LQHMMEFMRPVDLPNRLPFSAIPWRHFQILIDCIEAPLGVLNSQAI